MLPIGTKVFHTGHGQGEVIGHNPNEEGKYFKAKPKEVLELAITAGILSSVMLSLYSRDRYPNIIKFKTGYHDVYADGEVTVIN